jgi:hypothetical protein
MCCELVYQRIQNCRNAPLLWLVIIALEVAASGAGRFRPDSTCRIRAWNWCPVWNALDPRRLGFHRTTASLLN